jgi:hypothetical protein
MREMGRINLSAGASGKLYPMAARISPLSAAYGYS